MDKVLNYLLYQTGWFCCVLGVAWRYPWWGAAMAAGLLAIHLVLAEDRQTQLKLMLVAAVIGLAIDTALLCGGAVGFPPGTTMGWLPPLAMTILWVQFASTLRYCMNWLSGRMLLAAVFGLVGAPLAFFAGERLGAIEFAEPRWLHFALLGIAWSAAMPLLVFLSDFWGKKTAGRYRWFSISNGQSGK